MRIIEDLIAVLWISGEPFSYKIFIIITLLAIPFGIISELLVDKQDLIDCKLHRTC